MCHRVSAETEQRTGRIAFAFRPMQQELVNLQCSDDNRLHENIIAEYVIAALWEQQEETSFWHSFTRQLSDVCFHNNGNKFIKRGTGYLVLTL